MITPKGGCTSSSDAKLHIAKEQTQSNRAVLLLCGMLLPRCRGRPFFHTSHTKLVGNSPHEMAIRPHIPTSTRKNRHTTESRGDLIGQSARTFYATNIQHTGHAPPLTDGVSHTCKYKHTHTHTNLCGRSLLEVDKQTCEEQLPHALPHFVVVHSRPVGAPQEPDSQRERQRGMQCRTVDLNSNTNNQALITQRTSATSTGRRIHQLSLVVQ